MALVNLSGWNSNEEQKATAACGTSCGADKPSKVTSTGCGSACGAGKPEK
ncbi:MAG: ACGX-repeat peptide [Lachnospiraceae bacterium]|nr:ACGX-repeat peptide [Lachnospiraceae bacterium]